MLQVLLVLVRQHLKSHGLAVVHQCRKPSHRVSTDITGERARDVTDSPVSEVDALQGRRRDTDCLANAGRELPTDRSKVTPLGHRGPGLVDDSEVDPKVGGHSTQIPVTWRDNRAGEPAE